MVCEQCQGSTRGGFGVASQKLHQEPEVQELQQEPQAQGLTGARGGSHPPTPLSPYQFLWAEADEDPLSVFAVVSALHEGQEELGGIVLVGRSPC